jgi:hypothetical protein
MIKKLINQPYAPKVEASPQMGAKRRKKILVLVYFTVLSVYVYTELNCTMISKQLTGKDLWNVGYFTTLTLSIQTI